MLRLFRQLRQSLIMPDNARKYLFYAFGEVLLVVIGILIALQVNNWKENETSRDQEQVYLQLIHDDLILQKNENELQRTTIENHMSTKDELTDLISSRFQVPDDQKNMAKALLSTILIGRTYGAYEATFLDLTSSGNISLISDPALKNQIIQHYQIQKRDRDVINNNSLNTFLSLWTQLVERNAIILNVDLSDYIKDTSILNFDPSMTFLDDILFENLSKDENLMLIHNVLVFKVIAAELALNFIDRSDERIDGLLSKIEAEMEAH